MDEFEGAGVRTHYDLAGKISAAAPAAEAGLWKADKLDVAMNGVWPASDVDLSKHAE
jgi:hypothetical protein